MAGPPYPLPHGVVWEYNVPFRWSADIFVVETDEMPIAKADLTSPVHCAQGF